MNNEKQLNKGENMENQSIGTFQAVVVTEPGGNPSVYIIDTRNGNQYHRSHLDGKMCRCNKIVEWENEGKREFMDIHNEH